MNEEQINEKIESLGNSLRAAWNTTECMKPCHDILIDESEKDEESTVSIADVTDTFDMILREHLTSANDQFVSLAKELVGYFVAADEEAQDRFDQIVGVEK